MILARAYLVHPSTIPSKFEQVFEQAACCPTTETMLHFVINIKYQPRNCHGGSSCV